MTAEDKRRVDHLVSVAVKFDVPPHIARSLAVNAIKLDVKPSLAFALGEQESNFRSVFGHDVGGMFPGEAVTKDRYKKLVEHIKDGGSSNGVGVLQITYYTILLAHPKLWRLGVGIRVGLRIIRDNVRRYGLRKGLAVYNGGAGNPQYGYADEVIRRKDKWRRRFA